MCTQWNSLVKKKLLNSDAQVRPKTRRPSSAITLSLFHFLAVPEKKKKFNCSNSRGILCFLNHLSFPGDESEPGFKDQKIPHYPLFHCSASEIRCAVSVSTVKFFRCLSWLPYIGLSGLSFPHILLFLPLGPSAWFPCPHCLLCVSLLILQPACLLEAYLFSQEGIYASMSSCLQPTVLEGCGWKCRRACGHFPLSLDTQGSALWWINWRL